MAVVDRHSKTQLCVRYRRRLSCAVGMAVALAGQAQAGPGGGEVVGGSGSITREGAATTITQQSSRLSINWDSFNIAADERVEFVQPGRDSVALNRVLGNDASQILGQLQANGQVVLVNPNGIFFSESATVDVGGMVASGLDINSDDFMNADLVFEAVGKGGGVVINQGLIKAAAGGNVALLGKRVGNEGMIDAKLGSVALAAGRQAVLTFDPQGLLGVRVTKQILQKHVGDESAVANSGYIKAAGGRVLLTASASQEVFSQAVNSGELAGDTEVLVHDDGSFTLGKGADLVNSGRINVRDVADENPDIYELGLQEPVATTGKVVMLGDNIHHSGEVDATSYQMEEGGEVVLAASDRTSITGGTIDVGSVSHGRYGLGGTGGNVNLLGKSVVLTEGTQLHASGLNGGTLSVGGAGGSKNSRLRDTKAVLIDETAHLNVEGNVEGSSGGEINVWSRNSTQVAGFLDLSGERGSGGTGTLASEGALGYSGTADLGGGTPGTLVLRGRDLFVAPDPASSRVSEAALANALSTGSVALAARNRIAVGAAGAGVSLEVEGPGRPYSFSLAAGGSITFTDSWVHVGDGVLGLSTGDPALVSACFTNTAPDVYLINSVLSAPDFDWDVAGGIHFDPNSSIAPSEIEW